MNKYSILLVIAFSTSNLFCFEIFSDSSQPHDKLNSTHEKYLKAYALLNGEGGEKDAHWRVMQKQKAHWDA